MEMLLELPNIKIKATFKNISDLNLVVKEIKTIINLKRGSEKIFVYKRAYFPLFPCIGLKFFCVSVLLQIYVLFAFVSCLAI